MNDINDIRLDWIDNAAKQIENTGESPERSVERATRLMDVAVAHSQGEVLEFDDSWTNVKLIHGDEKDPNQQQTLPPLDGASCSASLFDWGDLPDEEIKRCKAWTEFTGKRGVTVDKIPSKEFAYLDNGQAIEKANDIVVKNGGQQFLFIEKNPLDGYFDYLATVA